MSIAPWTTDRATLLSPLGEPAALCTSPELASILAARLNGEPPRWGACSADCARSPGCCCVDYLALPVAERAALEGGLS